MRHFPSVHVQTSKLLTEAGLKTISFPLDDSHSLFHNCGHTARKKDVKIFTTEGTFYGKRVEDIAKAANQRFEAVHGKIKDPFLNKELINISVREYFKKYGGANDAEVDFWMKYSGYNLYDDDVQASIFVAHGQLYGSDCKDHVFVSKGYSMLASWLLDGISIGFNHRVNQIVRNGDIVEVSCSLPVEPFQRKFLCSTLFISLSKKDLMEISGVEEVLSRQRIQCIEGVKSIPLFKCFLEYERKWWSRHGFTGGKTTTETPCRQIHYYDDCDLLIYNSGDFAVYWYEQFMINQIMPLRKMHDEVKLIHKDFVDGEIPDPLWEQCTHKFWPSGSHKWKKGYNSRVCINMIADGSEDGIYITGDAFSSDQGWVEGAINMSDKALEYFAIVEASKTSNDTEEKAESCCCCCWSGGTPEEKEYEDLEANDNAVELETKSNSCICCHEK